MEKITDVQESKHQKGDPSFEKSIKHYSNSHQILLVGEGDFSFSLALANVFESAGNMVVTSKDSRERVLSSYKTAHITLSKLESLGAKIYHEVDATKLEKHPVIGKMNFDRIVFNFPHAGFLGRETNKAVIKKHRHLIKNFFKSASTVLSPTGEIHVTHRSDYPYHKWKLDKQAEKHGLDFRESVPFCSKDYRGYVNRRGAGDSPADSFYLRKCQTYKFTLRPDILKLRELMAEAGVSSDSFSESPIENYMALLKRLKSERYAREAAEKEKAGLKSDLKIADDNTKSSAELTSLMNDAADRKPQVWKGKENVDNTNLKRTLNLRADNNTSQRIGAVRHQDEALKSKKEEINRKETESEKQNDELKKQNDELEKQNDELKKKLGEALGVIEQLGVIEELGRQAKERLERLKGTSFEDCKGRNQRNIGFLR